jgi:hypothetical protein
MPATGTPSGSTTRTRSERRHLDPLRRRVVAPLHLAGIERRVPRRSADPREELEATRRRRNPDEAVLVGAKTAAEVVEQPVDVAVGPLVGALVPWERDPRHQRERPRLAAAARDDHHRHAVLRRRLDHDVVAALRGRTRLRRLPGRSSLDAGRARVARRHDLCFLRARDRSRLDPAPPVQETPREERDARDEHEQEKRGGGTAERSHSRTPVRSAP